MKYSKTKARERKSRLSEIKNKINGRRELFDTNSTENNAIPLRRIKSEYNSLYEYIFQGNVTFSRVNWYEYSEKIPHIL